eukprot:5914616-Heterocapsa_arctica.AAC.1
MAIEQRPNGSHGVARMRSPMVSARLSLPIGSSSRDPSARKKSPDWILATGLGLGKWVAEMESWPYLVKHQSRLVGVRVGEASHPGPDLAASSLGPGNPEPKPEPPVDRFPMDRLRDHLA